MKKINTLLTLLLSLFSGPGAQAQTVEKIAPGIWKLTNGTPEKYLPTAFKATGHEASLYLPTASAPLP